MSDVREAIRAKINECVAILAELRYPAEVLLHAREMLHFYSTKDPDNAPVILNANAKLEEAARAVSPFRERLVTSLRQLVAMGNEAEKAGFDADFTGIQNFVALPDSTRAHTLEAEFNLIEHQLSVDPIPVDFPVESLIESQPFCDAKSTQIVSWLESELRGLVEIENSVRSASEDFKSSPSDRELWWKFKVARRQAVSNRQTISALSRILQRRLLESGISQPLDSLYSLIADWERSHLSDAIKEVMWAGDQLAVKPAAPAASADRTGISGIWREFPLDDHCTEFVDPDEGLINAMRKIVTDWSDNWNTVRVLLRKIGYSPHEFPTMTIDAIRQAIILNLKQLIVEVGGTTHTASSHIVAFQMPPVEDDSALPRRPQSVPVMPEEAVEDHLSEILEALLELGAFDQWSRKSATVIARKAVGPDADPGNLKRYISILKKRGDIGTKGGRTGGAWLTAKGRVIANASKNKQ